MMRELYILLGAANIARELTDGLRAFAIAVAASDIEWNEGRGLFPTPERLQLAVRRHEASPVIRMLKREDVADAAWRITKDVREQIQELVIQCVLEASTHRIS